MGFALRWKEEPFLCELSAAPAGKVLKVFSEGKKVWEEPVQSAAAAYTRAQEIRAQLLAPAAAVKRA